MSFTNKSRTEMTEEERRAIGSDGVRGKITKAELRVKEPSMPEIASVVRLDEPIVKRVGPVWRGPCSADPKGGITQGMMNDYLACRERFRIHVIEGLTAPDLFSAPLEFGNLWHCAEEAHARRAGGDDVLNHDSSSSDWVRNVESYYEHMCAAYPFDRDHCRHWYMMALAMFPKYVAWWEKHHDQSERVSIDSEKSFRVPYTLPSGRVVQLRGKRDSVDLVKNGPEAGVWIQENKTKSSIDSRKIEQQLTFDLQTMVYSIAYLSEPAVICNGFRGVRYNVIKRPAHKSVDNMLKSLTESIADGRGGEWFWRRNVEISVQDVEKFKQQCLNPVLENICDDYEWWGCIGLTTEGWDLWDWCRRHDEFPHHCSRHFRLPFGIYNPLTEIWSRCSELDTYLATGSTAGLVRTTNLFPELTEESDGVVIKHDTRTVEPIKQEAQNASNQ